jgi:hypothetical protein
MAKGRGLALIGALAVAYGGEPLITWEHFPDDLESVPVDFVAGFILTW